MILITGASSGIGEACARAFAKAGRDLWLVARRRQRLESLAHELRRKYGVKVEVSVLDVSQRKTVAAWGRIHKKLLQKIDVLINNAGLARGLEPLQKGKPQDWDEMINTNVKGLLYVTHEVLPVFVARGRGHIVNLGSVAGHWVYPKGNVYCATKAAVRSLTEALRLDLIGTGVRVTSVDPGMVETEFSVVRLGDRKRAKAVYAGMTPLTAADVAETVLWCVQRPGHVNVQTVVLYPTDQASPTRP